MEFYRAVFKDIFYETYGYDHEIVVEAEIMIFSSESLEHAQKVAAEQYREKFAAGEEHHSHQGWAQPEVALVDRAEFNVEAPLPLTQYSLRHADSIFEKNPAYWHKMTKKIFHQIKGPFSVAGTQYWLITLSQIRK